MSYTQTGFTLREVVEREAIFPAGGSQTNVVVASGLRGLAVFVPNGWTAANIAFIAVYGANAMFLRTALGTLAVISGISTSIGAYYIAPSECWALGGIAEFRLASVDSSGVAVTQSGQRVCKLLLLL